MDLNWSLRVYSAGYNHFHEGEHDLLVMAGERATKTPVLDFDSTGGMVIDAVGRRLIQATGHVPNSKDVLKQLFMLHCLLIQT